jgi:DNA ligase (NAD+)
MELLILDLSTGNIEQKLKNYDMWTLKKAKKILEEQYFNTGSNLSDERYDILTDYLDDYDEEEEDDTCGRSKKIKLPFYMGSLDKFKPENVNEIERWCKKFPSPYIVTPKLDGLACLIEYVNEKSIKIYTKGKSKTGYGSDISHFAKIVKNISPPHKDLVGLYVRGELIMSEKVFEKYKDDFSNARQLVAGVVNSKTISKRIEIAKEIEFISYEIVQSNGQFTDQRTQLELLSNYGFKIPQKKILGDEITPDLLTSVLLGWKKSFNYFIDGIVVTSSGEHTRNIDDNPKYSFAFKVMFEDSVVNTTVVKVLWKISKRSLAKPRVQIVPTQVGGVTVTYSSGFNAKFIKDNNIGPGAEIKIVRSGDVIPYIVDVIRPANKPDMPSFSYVWNESGVDIVATDSQSDMCVSVLTHFFKTIGVEYLGPEGVKKLFEHGYTSLESILDANVLDLSKIDGMGHTSAKKIYNNIHSSLQNIKIPILLSASGTLGSGVGSRKISLLLKSLPTIFNKHYEDISLVDKICQIKGFNVKTAELIVKNLKLTRHFLKRIKKYATFYRPPKDEIVVTRSFDGKKIVFSGIRDKHLEESIVSRGGEVTTSVSKNTSILVVKDVTETSGKIQKAKELGIVIISIDNFRCEFF